MGSAFLGVGTLRRFVPLEKLGSGWLATARELSALGGRKGAVPMESSGRRFESLADAAERTGVSTRTLRRLIAAGALTAYRLGPRLLRVDPEDVDGLLVPVPAAQR